MSIEKFQEALNTANHHAGVEESNTNQHQNMPPGKKSMASIEQKEGSDPATAFELIPGQAAGVDTELRALTSKVMQIKTDRDGNNSGRTYYISANESDDLGQMIARLSSLAKSARKRAENKSRFERNQLKVRRFYNSRPFQYFMAVLIFGVELNSNSSLTPDFFSLNSPRVLSELHSQCDGGAAEWNASRFERRPYAGGVDPGASRLPLHRNLHLRARHQPLRLLAEALPDLQLVSPTAPTLTSAFPPS